ncbi:MULTISPECIES: PKD domain-containing protein [unclassified Frankia]|uniref:PKD domain-containing protein n=1 Tax=unclassified Frankia TaxID=2632575 RepID=UPI002AD517BE|nr:MULTISPECIES: PKD domain-containing protein [unclassified Frankia]
MRRRRLTRPVRTARWVPVALAGVVVLGALVAAGWLGDVPARSVALDDGSAWLVSSVGQAALVDGSSAQVVAQVKVGEGGADLSSAQSGADAYVANTSDGSVRRVDGATFAVSSPARFANAGQALAVYPGRQAVYAVSAQSGLVTTADPLTLQVRAQQSLAARVAPGAAQLDGAGRLWLVDANTGDLIWLDGAGRHTRRGAVDPARATLVRSGDTVVIVDVVARTARPLRADGGTDTGGCVDTQAGDSTVTVAGSTSADRVYAASGRRGVLLVSDLSRGSCDTAVDLRAAGHDLGAPHEAAGRVFIPDFTAGQVIVVDVGARRLVASAKVLPERTRFELVSQGSFMFYNDPHSAQAGVVHLDGSVRQTEKYNPKNPGNGVFQGPGSGNPTQSSPTQSSPTQSPVTSPPTGPTTPPTGQPQQAKGDVQIRVSATQVVVNQPVELRVVATNGGIVAAVAWTFGDDAPTSGVQVSHSWPKPGVYTVRAQTRLADGRQVTPTATITVTESVIPTQTPSVGSGSAGTGIESGDGGVKGGESGVLTALLDVSPPSGPAPLDVTANASGSRAGSAPIVSYTFDFGDRTAQVGPQPGATATHRYTQAGSYTVSLTVTDRNGGTATRSASVAAGAVEAGPTARLSAAHTPGGGALDVTADASGSRAGSAPIMSYTFDFGDRTAQVGPQAGATATHRYSAAGTYSPTVTVTDSAGRTDTYTTQVTAQQFTLAVSVSGNGSGKVTGPDELFCPDVCQAHLNPGTQATLSAAAVSGSTFGGWSGDCTGTGTTCTVTMDKARNVTARFDTTGPSTYPLTVTANGNGRVDVSGFVSGSLGSCSATCTVNARAGEDVTLTAWPASGWNISGWSASGCAGSSCTVTMNQARNVTVTFAQQDQPPTAALTATRVVPNDPYDGRFILDASGSSDTDATPIRDYTFDFGDGSQPVKQTGPRLQHGWGPGNHPGTTYNPKVYVTDTAGKTSMAQTSVYVKCC